MVDVPHLVLVAKLGYERSIGDIIQPRERSVHHIASFHLISLVERQKQFRDTLGYDL